MTTPDRDRSLEQWLRRTPIPGAAADSCLDAETLAAWADGVLSGAARSTAEAHAANCARCQAMLAVMARTTPAPSQPSRSFLQKWLMILGPAAAAATAVALWFAVGQQQRETMVVTPAVQTAATGAAAKPSAEVDVQASFDSRAQGGKDDAKTVVAEPTATRERATLDKRADSPALFREGQRENEQKAAPADSLREVAPPAAASRGGSVNAQYPGPPPQQQLNQAAANQSQFGQTQANSAASSQVQGAQTEASQARLRQMSEAERKRLEAVPASASATASPASAPVPSQAAAAEQAKKAESQLAQRPPPAVQESVAVTAESPKVAAPPAPPASPATPNRAAGVAGGIVADEMRASSRMVAPLDVTSPDNSARWRVLERRMVQRSTDGGATWATQFTAAEDVELTAGASASPAVCWFVGRAGVVIVTTDGRQWQSVKFPERVDLVSVVATDARSARITTVDSRVFATTDLGTTWARR